MSKPPSKMDERCPRQLEDLPDSWCPQAVIRLKALRHAGRELTEAEEAALPGCPWSINHQLANYCFFKLISEFIPDKPLSDMEIAHFTGVPKDAIKKIEKRSLEKIRQSQAFDEIIDDYGDSPIIGEDFAKGE